MLTIDFKENEKPTEKTRDNEIKESARKKMTALEVFNVQAEIINKYGNIFDANNSFYEEYSS